VRAGLDRVKFFWWRKDALGKGHATTPKTSLEERIRELV